MQLRRMHHERCQKEREMVKVKLEKDEEKKRGTITTGLGTYNRQKNERSLNVMPLKKKSYSFKKCNDECSGNTLKQD